MNRMQTLNPLDAHNAVGARVALYTGIVADYERQMKLLRAENETLRSAVAKLRHAVQEPGTTASVPREAEQGRDQRVDSGALGQGVEGQEAPRRSSAAVEVGRQESEAVAPPDYVTPRSRWP